MKKVVFTLMLGVVSFGAQAGAAETGHAAKETQADHFKLASYYKQKAEEYKAQAKKHEAMRAGYQHNPLYTSEKFKRGTIDHCTYFVEASRESAAKMMKLAAMHEEMATRGETK